MKTTLYQVVCVFLEQIIEILTSRSIVHCNRGGGGVNLIPGGHVILSKMIDSDGLSTRRKSKEHKFFG